jgi:hypothetical protein
MSHPLHQKDASSFRALCASFFATILGLPLTCSAGDAFYQQLLKAPVNDGYRPTRSFTIVTDAERGNQLVAEDDPNLRFNLLWMQQFQPGYRAREGGAAIGELFRGYIKSAYKSYRERNAESFSALPDENGSIKVRSSYRNEIDYRLNLNDGDVKLKVKYSF